MTQAQQLRQKLLDLLVDVDGWMAANESLQDELAAVKEQNRRLDHERLGAVLRLEAEVTQTNAEWSEKVVDLVNQVQTLTDQVHAQNQEILDARQRFARALEINPTTLTELVDKALILIDEGKKILREHL